MNAAEIRDLLPWRYPFLMIDRMLDCEVYRSIVTLKNVTAGDPAGAVFPSMLLLEGMSQSAALLFRLSYGEESDGRLPLLGFLKASMGEQAILPGDAVTYSVRSVKMTSTGGVFEGQATVDSQVVASAELAFAAAARDDEESDG